MKWLVFVEGGLYSGDTGCEGIKVIELEDGPVRDTRDVWALLMDRGLCGHHMNDAKIANLKGTKIRVFKAEEVDFPHLDLYMAEREDREAMARDEKKRETEEDKLKKLAARLGYRIEKT